MIEKQKICYLNILKVKKERAKEMTIEINQIKSTYEIEPRILSKEWHKTNDMVGMLLGFKKIKF